MKTKKVFAILISVLLLIGLLPIAALAAWEDAPAINMVAEQNGDEITVQVSVAAAADLSAFGFNMSYPTEKVTLKSTQKQLQRDNNGFYTALDEEGEQKGDQATVNIAAAGTVAFQIAIDSNTSFAKDATILKVVFTVNEGATGRIEFGLTDLSAGSAGKGSYNYTEEETPSAAIVPPISAITLAGTVTTPAKGVTDATALTATPEDVTVTTAWTPTLEGGKFAANTEYTLTITVAPKSGATLTDDCTVTYTGYTFTKSGTGFVATKTFEKTASKAVVSIAITSQPTKKAYVYGEELDKTDMVVTATFDDESTETVTDYTVSELKVGDTTATITYQGKTATVNGLTVSKAQNPAVIPEKINVTFNKSKDLNKEITGAEGDVTFTCDKLPEDANFEKGVFTAGETAYVCTVDVKIAGNANYEAKEGKITVNVISKPEQEDFTFGEDQTKKYGDPAFTVTATGNVAGSTVTYMSGNEAVATVNGTSGEITIKGAGTATITATASETEGTGESEGYAETSRSFVLTVEKAEITVTAIDKTVNIGGDVPSLAAPEKDKDYKVEGLVGEDALAGTVKLVYKDEAGYVVTPDTAAEGAYVIAFDCEAYTLNPDTANYSGVKLVDGKLTVSIPSSGGGSSSATTYEPTITAAEHGKVTVDPTKAKAGDPVKITATPDEGYELESLTVTDASGAKIETAVNADGTYSYKQPAGKVTITAKFKARSANPFTDVEKGAYYYDAVLWAAENGITTGATATTFSPDSTCTRGQLVTFIWRAAGSPEPTATVNPFTDVAASDYYYKAVLWAYENGITKGTTDTTFSPDAPVTRGQTVTFLYRWKGTQAQGTTPFTDLEAGAYYTDAVLWAYTNGVTLGLTDTTFGPDQNCLRGQIVTFLYRAVNLK